jgi:hypothetical protein
MNKDGQTPQPGGEGEIYAIRVRRSRPALAQAIERQLIKIPPPRKQRKPDGTFTTPSDNALAFYVIAR